MIIRFTDRHYTVNGTVPKVLYTAPNDLPVFKNRLRATLVTALLGTPEENKVLVIPIMRGQDPITNGPGVAVELETPMELVINQEVVNSLCDACTTRPTCIDFAPRLYVCGKVEIENGTI